MACETLCIYGESGTGKSTSLRNMDPKTTFIISTTGKPLPFRGWRKKYTPLIIEKDDKGKTKSVSGNYYISSNWESILKILKIVNKLMPHIKAVILDDKK